MSIKFNPLNFEGLDLSGEGTPVGIGVPVPGSVGNSILTTDALGAMDEKVLTDGQLLIGDTGGEPVVASLTGTVNRITVTPGAGSITLDLPQDINTDADVTFDTAKLEDSANQLELSTGVNKLTLNSGTSAAARVYTVPDVGVGADFVMTEGAQSIDGTKTFEQTTVFSAATGLQATTRADIANVIINNSSVDVSPTLGTDVLNLGALTADVVNIGNPGSVVNIQGTVNNIATTNLNVTDSLITVNDGGPAASGGGAGIEVEENAVATGHLKVSAGRDAWSVKAPLNTGTIELQPPATGTLTINQGTFDLKADTNLSNLSGTSINTNLLPDTDVSHNIGSTSRKWNAVFTQFVTGGTGNLFLNSGTHTITMNPSGNINPNGLSMSWGTASNPWGTVVSNNILSGTGVNLKLDSATGIIDADTARIINVVNPTNPQDAATKDYVDSSIPAVGANLTLSNLDSPTDINQSLIPQTNFAFNLGSNTRAWGTAYVDQIVDGSNVAAFSVGGRELLDASGNSALSFGGLLVRSNKSLVISATENLILTNSAASHTVDISASGLTNTYTLTLPVDAGSTGQFLQTDGSGVTSWQTVAAPTPVFTDSAFRITDDVDTTKRIAFEASGIALSTTRTITMPNANVNLGDIANKAERSLNNLTTTSINESLTPSSDLSRDLGELTARWNRLRVREIDSGTSNLTLTGNSGSVVLTTNELYSPGFFNLGRSTNAFSTIFSGGITAAPSSNLVIGAAGGSTVSFNSKTLDDIGTPTLTNQAATKGYVDTNLSNRATLTLNNLTSPTNINQGLRPDADLTQAIGEATRRWSELWTPVVNAGASNLDLIQGSTSLRFSSGELRPGGAGFYNLGTSSFPFTNVITTTVFNPGNLALSSGTNVVTAPDIRPNGAGRVLGNAANPWDTLTTSIVSAPPASNLVLVAPSGVINTSTARLTNVVDPTSAQDAATKAYVDASVGVVNTSTSLTGGGTISLTADRPNQTITVGAASAISLSTTPFTATAPLNGTTITLIGNSNTNTVTILSADIAKSCVLNGDCTLGLYDTLTVRFIAALDRYVEISRG